MVTLDYHLCAFGGMMMDEDEKFDCGRARCAEGAKRGGFMLVANALLFLYVRSYAVSVLGNDL